MRKRLAGFLLAAALMGCGPKHASFVKVDNVFDRDPVAAPQTNTGIDINPLLYDTLGRVYRAGLRYNF